ncbi:hypothetical protein DC522_15560 [Microvirga sp. KLBC 81]|nr:hypothetical protein DC522_15560 [Microvirga sp. KLBC 81]
MENIDEAEKEKLNSSTVKGPVSLSTSSRGEIPAQLSRTATPHPAIAGAGRDAVLLANLRNIIARRFGGLWRS